MPVAVAHVSIGEAAIKLQSRKWSLAADEWGWEQFEVANGVTDSDIHPQNITTITVLYIESDQAVTWEHNSADTRITLNANSFALLFGTSITALTISNASGSTANITLGWWGT